MIWMTKTTELHVGLHYPLFSLKPLIPEFRIQGSPWGDGQQQHSALSALKIRFLITFQALDALDPDVVGSSWGWSLGMSASMDGSSSKKPMFRIPVAVASRTDSWEERLLERWCTKFPLISVSPGAMLMTSAIGTSLSGIVLSEQGIITSRLEYVLSMG